MTRRMTLQPRRWYACEFIGDEFEEDRCSYSPIRIERLDPLHTGKSRLRLGFYHANYPEGVRSKIYTLVVLERGRRFLLARSTEHDPARLMQIYDIDWAWLERHFTVEAQRDADVQEWLSRNF